MQPNRNDSTQVFGDPSTLLLHGCQRTVLLRRCWWLQLSLRSFALSGFIIKVSSDLESFVDLAWNQNASTLQALNPSVFNTACRMGPSASDTSCRFQSKGIPCAASYASTSLNTIGWSQKAAAHSSRGLANRPGASTLMNVSTSPKNSAKLFLSTRSAVYVSGQTELLGIAVVEIGLLLLWSLDHADDRDCSAGFFLEHFCTFFSLARHGRKPLEFELYLVQLICVPRELGGHLHEILFHAV